MTAIPSLCPRCRSTTVTALAASPVPGVWMVFQCTSCLYTWRSTEPPENTTPDNYPAAFRLDPKGFSRLAVIPAVAPRRPAKAVGG